MLDIFRDMWYLIRAIALAEAFLALAITHLANQERYCKAWL